MFQLIFFQYETFGFLALRIHFNFEISDFEFTEVLNLNIEFEFESGKLLTRSNYNFES